MALTKAIHYVAKDVFNTLGSLPCFVHLPFCYWLYQTDSQTQSAKPENKTREMDYPSHQAKVNKELEKEKGKKKFRFPKERERSDKNVPNSIDTRKKKGLGEECSEREKEKGGRSRASSFKRGE